MQQSPPSAANIHAASRIPLLLLKTKVRYHANKATGSCPEPDEPDPPLSLHRVSRGFILIAFHRCLGLPNNSFPPVSPTSIFYASLIFPMRSASSIRLSYPP